MQDQRNARKLREQRLKDRYPAFNSYGTGPHKFLTVQGTEDASQEDRMASVWPFMVRQVRQFHQTLRAREQASYDPEDILLDLWISLREKDHKWEAEKGTYVAFAGYVIRSELSAIRARTKGVKVPENAHDMLKGFREKTASGTLPPKSAQTFKKLITAVTEMRSFEGAQHADKSESFQDDFDHPFLTEIIMEFPPRYTQVLKYGFGFWGTKHLQTRDLAKKIGVNQAEVKRIKKAIATHVTNKVKSRVAQREAANVRAAV